MDKRTAERWAKKLGSGDLTQTREILKDEKGYCCLGVLASTCSSSVKKKWGIDVFEEDKSLHIKKDDDKLIEAFPDAVLDQVVSKSR